MSTRTISSFTVTSVLPSQSPRHWIGVAGAVPVAVAVGGPGGELVDGVALAVLLGVDIIVGVPLGPEGEVVDGIALAVLLGVNIIVGVPLGPEDEVVDGVALAVLLGVDIIIGVPLTGAVTTAVAVTVAHEQHANGGPPLCGRQIASGPHCGF